MRWSASTLDGATCRLRLVLSMRSNDIPINMSTEFVLIPSVADGVVQLRVDRITRDKQYGGVVLRDRATPELLETTKKGDRVVRRAADDEGARATIEALTARAHTFVKLDEHAGILDYREDWDPTLDEFDVEGLGLKWALGLPHLPVESVRPGDVWLGQRYLAPEAVDAERGVPLRYQLLRVRDGVATIAVESKEHRERMPTPKGQLDVAVGIEGEARVRVVDGTFVDSDVHMTLTATLGNGASQQWRYSYLGACRG